MVVMLGMLLYNVFLNEGSDMSKYVMFMNNVVVSYKGKELLSKEEVIEGLKELSCDEKIEVDEEELSVEELFECVKEDYIEVWCDGFVEMGDDYVELGVFGVK